MAVTVLAIVLIACVQPALAARTACSAVRPVCAAASSTAANSKPASPPAKPPPELSPAQETALFNTLRAVLRAPPPYPGPGAQPSGAAATALEAARALAKAEAGVSRTSKPHPGVLGVLSAKYGVVRTANNAALVNDNGQPQGELIQLLSYLENDALRVGVDVVRGGVVGHISSPNMPVAFRGRSLINSYDCGRMLQQSYYGCDDGSCWAARPWRWNPVQCGSWENLPARLVEASVGEGRVRTSAVPRNWGNQELIEDVLLTSDYSLRPDALAVNFTMRYTGDTDHPLREQELPAVFADRRLSVLASYTGATPWAAQGTDDLTLAMPGGVNEPFKPTEHWAAYVEPDTGYGIGVFTPIASGLTAYRVGPNNSTRVSDVSYFALTSKYPIPANSTVSYRAYVAVGRLDEIRATFRRIAVEEGLAPPLAGNATSGGATNKTAPGATAAQSAAPAPAPAPAAAPAPATAAAEAAVGAAAPVHSGTDSRAAEGHGMRKGRRGGKRQYRRGKAPAVVAAAPSPAPTPEDVVAAAISTFTAAMGAGDAELGGVPLPRPSGPAFLGTPDQTAESRR